jgi:hypothetical protein
VGSVRIRSSVPGVEIPTGFLVFSLESPLGDTVATGGVAASKAATSSRLFVESSGRFAQSEPGSLQTGLAIANPSGATSADVTLELTALDGRPTGLRGSFTIAPGGQTAKFLYEIPGFEGLPAAFQGVLRISASSPVTTVGLRARYNERREFLLTTLLVVNENDPYFDSILRFSNFVFPHFVDGDGYTTKFVLFSGWTPGVASGNLEFFRNDGSQIPVPFQ